MGQLIAILEDNQERQQAMRECICRHLPDAEMVVFVTAPEMVAWLRDHVQEVNLLSLDHDLEFVQDGEGRLTDPGDGRDVAQCLAQVRSVCPVIIHTSNAPAASSMRFTLEDAGWAVSRVFPEADCRWIASRWIREVTRLLSDGK